MSPQWRARFRSLADAVRKGCQLVPDPLPARRYVGPAGSGRLGCDALVAAWFAEYAEEGVQLDDPNLTQYRYLSGELSDAYPVLSMDLGPGCPSGPQSLCPKPGDLGQTLEAKIIHLQDEHGLSREQVIAWLDAHSF